MLNSTYNTSKKSGFIPLSEGKLKYESRKQTSKLCLCCRIYSTIKDSD
jgi:hypothetical protein